jgi:hypothetical protein
LKLIIPNVISVAEAKDLRSEVAYLQFTDRRVQGILKHIYNACDASIEAPAYCRVEEKKDGHPWHKDTGTGKGHMVWCRYSARILLNPREDFTGGGFYFRGNRDDPIFGFRNLVLYDHTKEHFIASHKGQRRVLLMFLS